jgi:cephalosporin hydroxylase
MTNLPSRADSNDARRQGLIDRGPAARRLDLQPTAMLGLATFEIGTFAVGFERTMACERSAAPPATEGRGRYRTPNWLAKIRVSTRPWRRTIQAKLGWSRVSSFGHADGDPQQDIGMAQIGGLARGHLAIETQQGQLQMEHRYRLAADTALSVDLAEGIQRGTMATTYKGVSTLKCPFDLAIYQEVLWDLKPGTVLEFGSHRGGSALWLADTLQAFSLENTRLLTLDISFQHEFHDDRIEFRQCDVSNIEATLGDEFMATLARPLLVIEDSSHQGPHVRKVMEFFHRHSRPGDYLIVEDGIISLIMDEDEFEGGPLQAIHSFLAAHPGDYRIDRKRCDRYGRNVTWNLDGYMERLR